MQTCNFNEFRGTNVKLFCDIVAYEELVCVFCAGPS